MMKRIEVFEWIRSIEYTFLDSFYKKECTDKDVLLLLEKYLILKNFEPLEKVHSNLLNKFMDNEKDNFSNEIIERVYNILYAVASELTAYTKEKYNKFRKHNLLFFIHAFAISKNSDYGVWNEVKEILKDTTWYAGESGFLYLDILDNKNSDIFVDKDDKLLLPNNTKIRKVLDIAYYILRNFTNIDLIEESRKIDLWKDNQGRILDNSDIEDYFLYNKVFFEKFLKK